MSIIMEGSNKQRRYTLAEQIINIKSDKIDRKTKDKKKKANDYEEEKNEREKFRSLGVNTFSFYHLKYLAALIEISFSTNNSESNIAICAARPIILLVPDGML